MKILGAGKRVAAAAGSGGLLTLCFPGFNLGVLVWVWMIPLLLVLWTLPEGKRRGWRGFGLGWLSGAVFFGLNMSWLWTVSGLGAMAVAAFLALYFGAWSAFAATWGNPWRRAVEPGAPGWAQSLASLRFAFANAALWAGLEWLRGWLLTGFGWNGLGVAFHQTPVLAQSADLLGIAGLSFLPVFFQAVTVQAGRRMWTEAKRQGKWRGHLDFGVAVTLLALTFFYGVWRLQTVPKVPSVPVNVLLVQQNIPQSVKWQAQSAEDIYQGYATVTRKALAELEERNVAELQRAVREGDSGSVRLQQPDLVIWPETALPERLWYIEGESYPERQWNAGYIAQEILSLGDFTFITGVNEFEAERLAPDVWDARPDGNAYNAMAFFNGDFGSGRSYRKIHLVPFGEYIPLRRQVPLLEDLFQFSSGVEYGGDFSAGTDFDPIPVEAGGHEIGIVPAICFEDTVNRLIRRFLRPGPQMIVNVTNDGWFLESAAPEQHVANALFRCIETRRPMVRAANTGVTCIIDTTGSMFDRKTGDGSVRAIIDPETGRPFVAGTLYGEVEVPVQAVPTLYAMAGDLPVILLGMGGWLMGAVRRNR